MLSCMGSSSKYSCCLYPTGKESLDEAEVLMLESYCEKAQLKDGQDVLDLGCGQYCPFCALGPNILMCAHMQRVGKPVALSRPQVPEVSHHRAFKLHDPEAPH
jgi:hypothetical protein